MDESELHTASSNCEGIFSSTNVLNAFSSWGSRKGKFPSLKTMV